MSLHPLVDVLDNPVWHALTGPHRHLAERRGAAVRYRPDRSPFHALPEDPDAAAWADLAALTGPSHDLLINGPRIEPPAGWTVVVRMAGVQMVAERVAAVPDEEAVVLTAADVPAMLDLVERTQPGPFQPRTRDLGTYLGFKVDGRLVAMAGERVRPPGWTEISAVCTDPDWRGRGLASRLVRAVAHGIESRGDRVLLHTTATNVVAIGLYEELGFVLRRHTTFAALRSPAGERMDP